MQTAEKVLYLTFDDGVSPNSTPQLLHFLKQHEIQATHFLLGENIQQYPALVADLIAEKQQIAYHGFQHKDLWKGEFDAVLNPPNPLYERGSLFRPPYGHFTPKLFRWAKENGKTVVMWDVNSADFHLEIPTERLAKNLLQNIQKGSIVLLHDNPKFIHKTLELLEMVIPTLKAEGWGFEGISKISKFSISDKLTC
jgi:peptidoglycan-N-acetylglucosamine deacetylase